MHKFLLIALCTISLEVQTVAVSFAADQPAAKPTPAQALTRLQEGNARFVADQVADRATYQTQRAKLAREQHPFAIILTCSDSRVVPELIFDQQLGDVFVIRVAGNVTNPLVLGSIEYGVEHLGSPLIVVLGHSNCGAVNAAVEHVEAEGNLADVIKRVKIGDQLPSDPKQALNEAIKFNTLEQSRLAISQSKVIREFAEKEKVRVVAAVYSLDTGKIQWLETRDDEQAQ